MQHGKRKDQPTIVVMPMPKDTNSAGDVFGGWIMAQMDIAGAVEALRRAQGSVEGRAQGRAGERTGSRAGARVVTVAADAMVFHLPVFVGNVVAFYTDVVKVGRSSMQVRIEAWAQRADGTEERVTEGVFTYVKIGQDRRPVPVDQ